MGLLDRAFLRPPGPDDVARWAASGAMALTGPADGPPALPPVGLVPAVTALGESLAVASDALGHTIEVDALALLGERAALAGLSRQGRRSCGGSCELLPARDGWLAVSLPRPEDAALLPAWLRAEGALGELVAGRSAAELVAEATDLGLAVAALGEATGRRPPVVETAGASSPGRSTLAGAVALDLSSLWAGPLCAHLLGAAGARVIKVESTSRPDGARSGPAGFFDLLHGGHESVALDLADPAGRVALARLVDAADVVIEASRPRALAQLGIEASAVVARHPTVWVSITGHGRAAGLRTAFGDDAAVAGGLVASADERVDAPWFCADAIADPLTGLAAAVAVLEAWRRGGGWLLDISMAAVAAASAGAAPSGAWRGPVAPPRARPVVEIARPFGADTDAVVAELAAVATQAGP